ncbi:MAG: efflux RND transporter periplasmic adaptor subunit, partial [Desulfohalobiaceae bacterium]
YRGDRGAVDDRGRRRLVHEADEVAKRERDADARDQQGDPALVGARMQQSKSELEGKRATILYLESSLAYWQKEKQRQQKLAKQKATSLSEAEKTAEKAAEVQGRLQAARSEAEALQHGIQALKQQEQEVQTRLGYYTLRSPGPGTISERSVEPGDMASPSQVLLRLQNNKQLKIAFDVPQKDLPRIKEGLECTFSVNGEVRKSRIDLLHPALDQARMLRAEVWLQGDQRQGLSPGAYLPVSVSIKELHGVTLVPRSALIPSPAGSEHVFVVRKNRLQAREVQVLGSSQDRVAVKGISPGEQVLQNTYLGWARLSSGQRVEVVQ